MNELLQKYRLWVSAKDNYCAECGHRRVSLARHLAIRFYFRFAHKLYINRVYLEA